MAPQPAPISVRLPDGLAARITAAVELANERRPEGAPKVTRNGWIAAAVEAQLADAPRPSTPIPLDEPDAKPRSRTASPRPGPPSKRAASKSPGLPVHTVQHRQVASMHQWRINAESPTQTAATRMAVNAFARDALKAAGVAPPFEVKLVPWED